MDSWIGKAVQELLDKGMTKSEICLQLSIKSIEYERIIFDK